jgi:hypothetical protein
MKIIQSFVNPLHPYHIPIESFHIGLYSCLKSIELYGNCTFASNSVLIEKFKELGLPYTNYEVLDYNPNQYKFPFLSKLFSYKNQTESFIHLDLDFILFEKPEELPQSPIRFSHRDVDLMWDFSSIDGPFNSYFKSAMYFKEKYGKEFLKDIRINEIPNMGIVMCNNNNQMTESVQKVINLYFENQQHFDENWAGGCFLEQGLVHNFLFKNNDQYRDSVFDSSLYVYQTPPLIFINDTENSIVVQDWFNKRDLIYGDIYDFVFNYKFNDLYGAHFLGDSKMNKSVQIYFVHKLIEQIGLEKLEKIKFYFGEGIYDVLNIYKNHFM